NNQSVGHTAPPHPGFEILPSPEPPPNPLQSFEDDRRQFDERFQQQVERTYARSPAGFIAPPASQMTSPVYEVPEPYHAHSTSGAPVSPAGTPWPSRPAASPELLTPVHSVTRQSSSSTGTTT